MSVKELLLRSVDAAHQAPAAMTEAGKPLRVLLIQPPMTGGVLSLLAHVDAKGLKAMGFKPPLGLLYVATMVTRHSPHQVMVIDAIAEELDIAAITARAEEYRPDVIGISTWTDFWYPAWATGKALKEVLPASHLCYGGPHLGIFPKETLEHSFIDSVIVGDGELPFLYLCNMLSNDVKDNSFPGLHLKEYGVKGGHDTFYVAPDLDRLPHPDRTLLPLQLYGSVLGKAARSTTMITSRGCPHRCTFCKLNFQKTLARSAADVVDEFRTIKALGITEVEIYDDTFTWSTKRLREICQALIEADLGMTWAIRDRVSSPVDDDLMFMMARAGCRRIHYGIESGSQPVIERMKKRITLDQARDAVRRAKRAGLTVLTYFMFGNQDETEEDIRATIRFAAELDAHFAMFSITIPYAGTEMYTDALAAGLIQNDYWGEYARIPVPDLVPQVIERPLGIERLVKLRNQAVRRFYFRPRYVLGELRRLTSWTEFLRKARMGMQLAQSVYTK